MHQCNLLQQRQGVQQILNGQQVAPTLVPEQQIGHQALTD